MTPQEKAQQAIAASLHATNLSQILPVRQQSHAASMLGCSGGTCGSNALDVMAFPRLPNSMAQNLNASNNSFARQQIGNQYQGQPLLSREIINTHDNRLFVGHSPAQSFLGHFETSPQNAATILSHGNLMSPGVRAQTYVSPHGSLQQCLTPTHMMDTFDPRQPIFRGCVTDEKLSTNDKSSGSSCKSTGVRSRWKPNAHQLEILEDFFNSGLCSHSLRHMARYRGVGSTRATPELYAAVQGCGHASEHNINVWLKNRASRRKKTTTKKPSDHRPFYEDESDDDNPWEDFRDVSRSVMDELTSVFSGVDRSEVLTLARAIQDARHVCCYGAGKESLVMKAFASGLHHLGFSSFFVDDSNAPRIDNTCLVLISSGPDSPCRVSGMIQESIAAEARVIIFASYKQSDFQGAYTIHIPTDLQSTPPSDGEVISAVQETPRSALYVTSLFEMSVTLLCDCVCVMLRKANDVSPAKIRARHTNLE